MISLLFFCSVGTNFAWLVASLYGTLPPEMWSLSVELLVTPADRDQEDVKVLALNNNDWNTIKNQLESCAFTFPVEDIQKLNPANCGVTGSCINAFTDINWAGIGGISTLTEQTPYVHFSNASLDHIWDHIGEPICSSITVDNTYWWNFRFVQSSDYLVE